MLSNSLPLRSAVILSALMAQQGFASPVTTGSSLKTRGDAPCPANWKFSLIYTAGTLADGYTVQLRSDQGDDFAETTSVNVSGKFGAGGKWLYPGIASVTPKGSADVYKFDHSNYGFIPQTTDASDGATLSWTVQGCETPMTCTIKTSALQNTDPEGNVINYTFSQCTVGTDPGDAESTSAAVDQAYVAEGFCNTSEDNADCDTATEEDIGTTTVDRT